MTILSIFLFVLMVDTDSAMFSHALPYGAFLGVLLGRWGKMCHFQYKDNLVLITASGLEDPRIFKLIIFLFEGISSLAINFLKKLSLLF